MYASREKASGRVNDHAGQQRPVQGRVHRAERGEGRFQPQSQTLMNPKSITSPQAGTSRFGYSIGSGEMEGAAPEGSGWINSTGKDAGGPDAQPLSKDAGAPTGPRLKKTNGAVTSGNNGSFSWPATWSIENATSTTAGWIVQHVNVTQSVTNAAGTAITPGTGSFGGLRTAWYPIWEAWQVRGGAVFVGSSTSPHRADTYGQDEVGASTRGTTSVVGSADFYPNLTLPAAFTVTNSAPAWSLPVTTTDPALSGGTGALAHNLTATWDGVGGTGATSVTTV